ncbi:cupin domain-containing protein [Micromonospora sp. LZ34]
MTSQNGRLGEDIGQAVTGLDQLYRDVAAEHLIPLWTQVAELMPTQPTSPAQPQVWRWRRLRAIAERAGELVPVGRGGERRALALANAGLGGRHYSTPTLWAAIQYLAPGESAPEHRHTQNAFRFVVEGAGVWTVVDGDPVAMRRGDLLLTPGWCFHGHQNIATEPMAWLDGLDIPLASALDTSFFEFGPEQVRDSSTPTRSRAEELWAYPGLAPIALAGQRRNSPLTAYRWEHTDAALAAQLRLAADGYPGVMHPGHAAVRYTNPTTGGDVMPTIRAEFHRLQPEAAIPLRREVGTSVWQVFSGTGTWIADGVSHDVEQGDLFVVPSWVAHELHASGPLDLFRFSDTPVIEALGLYRYEEESTK